MYTNYFAFTNLIKQTFLFSFSTNKLNLRLIRASQYFFQFSFDVRHKSNRLHIVSNVLFKFAAVQFDSLDDESNVLNDINDFIVDVEIQTIDKLTQQVVRKRNNVAQ